MIELGVMKILMLGWELPPHNSGGLGVACLNLARALAQEGAEIDFVVPYEAEHPKTDFMKVLSAMKIDPLWRYGMNAYESKRLDLALFPKGDTEKLCSMRDLQKDYCQFVKDYLMDFKPDVVHAHDWLTFEAGMLAKKNFGLPLVAHVHATEFDRAGRNAGNPLILEIERESLTIADRIIAVSETTRQLVAEKYQIPKERIEVAYNSLDEDFRQTEYHLAKKNYQYLENLKKQGYKIITTVGRFTVQKGLKYFLAAAARALKEEPRLIFVLAGDGEERDELIMQAAEYKIAEQVFLTGFIRGRQLRDIYGLSDIFVMSSVSEPFGLTALEAAHHENALILTKQSGVSEVIRAAMTYDFWDEEKLAEEIVAVARSKGLAKVLIDDAGRACLKISWKEVAKRCIQVYDQVYSFRGVRK